MTRTTDPQTLSPVTTGTTRVIRLKGEDDWDEWRDAARRLLAARIPPNTIVWQTGDATTDLFAQNNSDLPPLPQSELRVSKAFPNLAKSALLHSDPARFSLVYQLLWLSTENPFLLGDHAHPLVRRVTMMAKAVRRDIHKMHAFVRFREVEVSEGDGQSGSRFIAWFEPEHHIVRASAGFFVRRFTQMSWSILTPTLSVHWDGKTLTESTGADRAHAPQGDALEEMWKAYYGATFNPSRLKIGAMTREMPRKYWKNLPEAQIIAPLIAGAQAREAQMVAQPVAPSARAQTLSALAQEAQGCKRCTLWKGTNGCVFGHGPSQARLMIIGEQPGDEEDKAQLPFIGPAGQVLDRALKDADINRSEVYLTNAVKHFKHTLRGQRRLHQAPDTSEIDACRWWLDQEMGLLRPRVTVMLGATAYRAVSGKSGAVGKLREGLIPLKEGVGLVSWHPAYILRVPDRNHADAAYLNLVQDLHRAASIIKSD